MASVARRTGRALALAVVTVLYLLGASAAVVALGITASVAAVRLGWSDVWKRGRA